MTKGNKVSFGEPEDILLSPAQGQGVRVPFTFALSESVGADQEPGATTAHEVRVRLSAGRAASWGLDAERARFFMIHAAVEWILEVGRRGEIPLAEEILVDEDTFPGPLPARFDRAIHVSGSTLELEREPGDTLNR
jgi:hypothetical protein